MIDFFQNNIVPILIAMAIGLIVGWWVWRRPASRRDGPAVQAAPPPPPAAAPVQADRPEAPPAPEPLPTATGPADNLQTMKGVGPKLAARLNEIGILRFDQLAALSPAQSEALDTQLGQFNGRIARDRLVEQAGHLARGDLAAYQATFGNLGSGNS